MSAIRLTLPDGSVREVPSGTTGRQLAEGIGPGLARAALAVRVNGQVRDLSRPIEEDAPVAILTDKDPDALEVLRHSSAHILATAVRELFPAAGIGFGPPIEDGFYYDFQVDRPFTPEDLERIEKKMAEVAARDYPFVREVVRPGGSQPSVPGRPAQAGADRRPGRRRDHHGLHRRPLRRPLPGAPCPRHRAG